MNIDKLIGDDKPLTPQQAFFAMYIFLDFQNKSCSNEMDVNQVLSDCSILDSDGGPADPAMWGDWLDAIAKARDDKNWDIARFTLVK